MQSKKVTTMKAETSEYLSELEFIKNEKGENYRGKFRGHASSNGKCLGESYLDAVDQILALMSLFLYRKKNFYTLQDHFIVQKE